MHILHGVPHAGDCPTALTIGNFDGVHLGHQAMLAKLREAASARGLPACVMTFEPHPREFFAPDKAPARLTSLREKLELLSTQGVDRAYVCRFNYVFAQTTSEQFVRRILFDGMRVQWLLVGDDFRFGARRAGDVVFLKQNAPAYGYEIEAMSSVTLRGERISSTAVREALTAGELARAAQLLGRPYSISGRVVRGDGLGRKLGFPTANIQMKHNRPPLNGIFVIEVAGIGETVVRGVASLGVRPTVKARGAAPVLEAHLLDFDADLYGRHLRIEFLHKLRDEEKYRDLETLTRQIALDVDNAREYFRRRMAETARSVRS